MVDDFGVKKAWKLFDLSKRVRPIDRTMVNDKSATRTMKNPIEDNSVKVKKMSAKAKNKSTIMKAKFATKKVKNTINHERSKNNVREVTTRGKPIRKIEERR